MFFLSTAPNISPTHSTGSPGYTTNSPIHHHLTTPHGQYIAPTQTSAPTQNEVAYQSSNSPHQLYSPAPYHQVASYSIYTHKFIIK